MGSERLTTNSVEEKSPPSWWKLENLHDKFKLILKNTTVEPMVGGYIVSCIIANLATQNLNLKKACRVNLNYTEDVCLALERRQTENRSREEIQVQELVAEMTIWKTFIQSSIPTALIIFVGAWSDRTGRRKPAMLVPIIGEFLTVVGLILCTYFFTLPMEVAGFTEAIFPALTGGWMTMFMAVFSYVADITPLETRTLRIGIVNVFCSVGIPIGTALSGVLYRQFGPYGVYAISATLYVFCFAYGTFCVRESPKKLENIAESSKSFSVAKFFDFRHINEAFAVSFKRDSSNRRLKIAMLMVVVIVIMGPMHGEMSVMYLFTRVRFNWDEVNFSFFSTYMMVTNLLGTMFSVCVFTQILKMDDALVGFMSCMSKILASILYAFATTEFVFYLGPLVDIINGTSFIAMRSITSKFIPPDELGKVNSLYGVCESIVPLLYGPLYSYVYRKSLNTVPGAFFLVGGGLTVPAAIIFWWLYILNRREMREKQNEPDNNKTNENQISTINCSVQNTEKHSLGNDFELACIEHGTPRPTLVVRPESSFYLAT